MSRWQDSNLRPPAPKAGWISYFKTLSISFFFDTLCLFIYLAANSLYKSYLWQQKYDEAEKYINLDHDLSIKNNSQFGLGFVYAKYITLYLEYYDDINKAKEYLRKVKIIAENLENWGGLASIYAEFSRHYKSKGNIQEEKKYNDLKIKYIKKRDDRNKD